MARGVGHQPGGIQGLVELLAEHGEAVEYDLITLGLRLRDLGTPAFTWRDLLVIVLNLPRAAALRREQLGDAAEWGVLEYLMARNVEAGEGANWQRAGGKGARPKPLPRPGQKSESKRFGSGAIPISEFDDWWNQGVTA